jgi:hypothetical protein
MLELILILVVVISVAVYAKYDTISPKLVVKESASYAGAIVGATPEVVRTGTKVVKAVNAQAELDIAEAGELGPRGFKEGRVMTQKAVRDAFSDTNKWADETYKEATAKLSALKNVQAPK